MSYKTLLFEVRDHVAHITLNRPQALNTLDADMARELMSASIRCDEDPAVRAVADVPVDDRPHRAGEAPAGGGVRPVRVGAGRGVPLQQHAHLRAGGGAYLFDFALLDQPQELDLQLQRHFPNFIEE